MIQDHKNQYRTMHLGPIGNNQVKCANLAIGANWGKSGPIGANRSQPGRIGDNQGQMRPNGAKWVQTLSLIPHPLHNKQYPAGCDISSSKIPNFSRNSEFRPRI